MGALGNLGVSDASNNVSIFSNGTITASGHDIFATQYFGTQQINLIVNVKAAPTGSTPTLTFTIQEVDAGDTTTVFGNSASTTSITGAGVFTAVLTNTHSSAVKVSWVITGSSASFTGVYVTLTTKNTPDTQVVSGTVTATNPSVGLDGAASLADDTQVGGIVSTSAPTYTAGNLNALSLTTAGALRVDGSGVTQPVSGTVTANQGGSWTVTANQGTSPWVTSVSGTVAVTQSTSPWIVAGGGTAGTAATGIITIQGIAGMVHLADDGYAFATSAAPSYTNSTWNPLSVDLAGNLRVTGFVTTNKAATSSVTSVASSASNVQLLAANANRLFASIYNESSKQVYIKLGTTASNTSYSILLMPNSYWEVPSDYTGEIDAIWSSANGNARITELTP